MEGKRYYWLRLHDDFFSSIRIKKLRKMAGGDTYTIIYLKMQLKAMKTEGVLTWRGIEQDFVDELALDLDEEPDNVRVTLAYLLTCGLAETSDSINFFLPYAVANTGSEGASAQRVREFRERKALQCNNDVTPLKQIGNGEKEIEKEKEKEIDTRERDRKRFTPPALEEVKAYAEEIGCDEYEAFYDHFQSNGWKVGGRSPMKDWRAALRNWNRRESEFSRKPKKTTASERKAQDDSDRLLRMLGR